VYLSQLDNVTRAVIDECACLTAGGLEHFNGRYHEALQVGGSGRWFRDARKKVAWALKERERVHELREKLDRNTQRLDIAHKLDHAASGITVLLLTLVHTIGFVIQV
jgi:hypothetical protein